MPAPISGLSADGCRGRQHKLREILEARNLDAALIVDRRHVHYFTGYWCRTVFAALAVVEREGPTTLVTPLPANDDLACDQFLVYPSNHLGTLVDDHTGAALGMVRDSLRSGRRLGCDGPVPVEFHAHGWTNLAAEIMKLRRNKSPDEVALLGQAIAATEAAYAYAQRHLQAGVTEVELFAGMQMAAAEVAGEVLGEFGNDFQIGAAGSAPRRRPAELGEVGIFDLSVVLRGYRSDLCRSFIVGGQPSARQQQAYERVMHVLRMVEDSARPGVRCRLLFEKAHAMLEGFEGWSFPHHLGHGIGLSAHETPRLNPHWDDVLQVGDVFTVEPGLYGPDLRAGLRIEQNYFLGEHGLVRLSSFPTAL